MGRLLREAHPHLVLFSFFRGKEGEDGHDDKDHHDAQLPVGILRQPLQDERLVEADQLIAHRGAQLDADGVAPGPHAAGIGLNVGRILDITVVHHLAIGIEHNDGDGVVALDDGRHERQVGLGVGFVEGMHGLGPHLHLAALLMLQVAHHQMRRQQGGDGDEHRCHDEPYLHLSDPVSPLHTLILTHVAPVLLHQRPIIRLQILISQTVQT